MAEPNNEVKAAVELCMSASGTDAVDAGHRQIIGVFGPDAVNWTPVGDGNSMSHNEQLKPMKAFTEKPANAIDANLNREDGTEYPTAQVAAQELLTGDERIQVELRGDDTGRGCGDETQFSVVVQDSGRGRDNDNAEDFVTPVKSGAKKRGSPHLHGNRGIGGMQVLEHMKDGYQCVATSTRESPQQHTFTILRRNEETGNFEYLTVNGELIPVNGALDCGGTIGEKGHGTVVNLVNFEFDGTPSRLDSSEKFLRKFAQEFEDPAVPIKFVDNRVEQPVEYTYRGLQHEFENAYERVMDEKLSTTKEVPELGKCDILAFVAKSKEERERLYENGEISKEEYEMHRVSRSDPTDPRTLISINGRTHAVDSRYRLGSQGNVENIKNRTYVVVRPHKSPEDSDDPFNRGRYDFAQNVDDTAVWDAIYEWVRTNDTLQSINENAVSESGQQPQVIDDVPDDIPSFVQTLEGPDTIEEALGCEVSEEPHASNLSDIDKYDIGPVARHVIAEEGPRAILEEPRKVIDDAEEHVRKYTIASGSDDVQQSVNNYVGTLFESLVYAAFVDICEPNGYVVRHEPSIAELDGIEKCGLEPDTDIVVEEQDNTDSPVYVFSVKTSLKDRAKQSAFWHLQCQLSSWECTDDNCVTHDTATNMFETERDIRYGYITAARNDSVGSKNLLDMLDVGYVPADEVRDSLADEYALHSVIEHVINSWDEVFAEYCDEHTDKQDGLIAKARKTLATLIAP